MNEKSDALNLLGPQCSSWGLPNRGTSLRSYVNFHGAEEYQYIRLANKMISRSLA